MTTDTDANAATDQCLAVVSAFERFHADLARVDACSRLPAARQRLVELAVQTFPVCRWAAITSWPSGVAPITLTAIGEIPGLVDTAQWTAGDGPCPGVATDTAAAPVRVDDFVREERWPAFVAVVRGSGVRAMLAYRLPGSCDWCVLTLYSDKPSSFAPGIVRAGGLFATHAAMALARARDADQSTSPCGDDAETGRLVRSAVGRIMRAHTVSEQVALAMLRRTSSDLHRTVADVAAEVARTGTLPRAARR